MSQTTLKDLMKFWDYKLTIYCLAVFLGLSCWRYWKNVPINHESVYSRSGIFESVKSCGGSMNAKVVEVVDKKGNIIAWSRKKCEQEVLDKIPGKKYLAYFSRMRNEHSPIYLKVDGDVYFEPGINHRDILAILGIGFGVCFFSVVPVLHKRRGRALESPDSE